MFIINEKGELKKCLSPKTGHIVIPDDVIKIKEWRFHEDAYITSITIPKNVIKIYSSNYRFHYLKSIKVSDENKVYQSVNNCLIETQTKKLILGCENSLIPSDGSVTEICEFAFCGRRFLKEISIPNGITEIHPFAFLECHGIENLYISESVKKICDTTFCHCTDLKEMRVSEYNKNYHSKNNCLIETKTKTLIKGCSSSLIPSDGSVTKIEKNAFRHCNELTTINIPSSITEIGDRCFYGCHKLTEVHIPETVKKIGECAFFRCHKLEKITIPKNLEKLGAYAFYGCYNLVDANIPEGVAEIPDNAFSRSGLTRLTLPNNAIKISASAFFCSNLKKITINDMEIEITNMGEIVHKGTSNILTLPEFVERIGVVKSGSFKAYEKQKSMISNSIKTNHTEKARSSNIEEGPLNNTENFLNNTDTDSYNEIENYLLGCGSFLLFVVFILIFLLIFPNGLSG